MLINLGVTGYVANRVDEIEEIAAEFLTRIIFLLKPVMLCRLGLDPFACLSRQILG